MLAVSFPYLFLLVIFCVLISLFTAKRLAVTMLICLFAGYRNLVHTVAFNLPAKWQNEKGDSTLRIMTWNVQDFIDLTQRAPVRANMLSVINEYHPDILCVQEFTNIETGKKRVSVREEIDSLGYRYYFFSNDKVLRYGNTEIMRGVAMFSKYPLIDSGRVNINNTEMNENLIYASILFNKKPLRIYTAHLASFDMYRDTASQEKDIYEITYDRKKMIQYKLRETEQLHQEEVEIIKRAVSKSPYPVVYCGDLNITPCSYNYRVLKNNLQDAFIVKGSGVGATFYKILPTLRIDVCFADTSLNVKQCTVIDRKLSDHYPVVTDLTRK